MCSRLYTRVCQSWDLSPGLSASIECVPSLRGCAASRMAFTDPCLLVVTLSCHPSHPPSDSLLMNRTGERWWMPCSRLSYSVRQRRRNTLWHPLYAESKTMRQMNLSTKQKPTHKLREWTYGCQGGRTEEETIRKFVISLYTLLYLKWLTNKDPPHSTGHPAQCYVTPGWGENGWVPLLSTWNYHKIVSLLYSNVK